ncbi:MAG TPA: TonB-dependent receptor [Candidatus Dormibacteraeota bacterium]|nr:TonB-dependent receptor [Candidatus Dormibacteraeota bacterium]
MNRKAISSGILRASLSMGAFLLLLFWSAQPLEAQVDTGTILGTISDASGAPINGAKVTLTNEGTGAALSTTTGVDGIYKFTPIRIGMYKVAASFQGFQSVIQTHIEVRVGEDVVINFGLRPGSVTETVEVIASVPVLQTQNASVGQVVDSRSVNDLPLNGRNFTFLAQTTAGVNSPQADTRGNAATGAFAANGLRPAQNNYLLDGIDNNSDTVDFLNGTNFVVLPPVDAIDEFKVQTSGFSAEYGRSGAAVLNATIKSGTNEFHGNAWEFFRNDKLDAADFFENAGGIKKGALRQNQFGVSGGGPIIKNKIFIFGDYEGFRRVQGTVLTGSVPTTLERSSGFTNFTELLTQGGTNTDNLGRKFAAGTIFDPATTRSVTAGSVDPVTGLLATGTGFARDPFSTCLKTTTDYTSTGCQAGLNLLPASRLDANALKLLTLYPNPTSTSLFGNFANSPKLFEHKNAFDTRMDLNMNEKNQVFFRFSYADDPQFIPGIFGGIADGGGFAQGNQTANAQQSALGYTHTFNPNLSNVARAGLNYLHTTRNIPAANDLSNIPSKYGILGIPQASENGGLPAFGIGGLQTLGGNAFLPSDEVTSTFQLTDDLTKIYSKHTFKMGFEWQHVKFSTLQPPWSRGQFNYDGHYTDVPGKSGDNTGIAQLLLIPTATSLLPGQNGIDYVGGPNSVFVSNISLTDNGKNYYGVYGQDDWKVTNKLTLNLGLRWDYFQPVYEHRGFQANFIPGGPPTNGPAYLIPNGRLNLSFLTSVDCTNPANANFLTCLLAKDGIALDIGKFGKSLATGQRSNFAPRFGFAYQATPKLVARGGFGIFFNGFENRGFSPNLGENYPFQFNFSFFDPDAGHAINNFTGCATATPAGGPTFETGFSCTPLDPKLVNASGLALRGIQYNYLTPYSMGGNLTVQYQVTSSMSLQAGYVTTLARHLESFPGNNRPTSIAPNSVDAKTLVPFKDFGRNSSQAETEGSSYYHGLQTRIEKQFTGGLSFLAAYTWSKTRSDAGDLLNGGTDYVGYRAPWVPGFGIQKDYKLANFDIRNVFHFSGGYELPFGKRKKFMSDASGLLDRVVGGWSMQWIATLQGGQPITLSCVNNTLQSVGCGALFTGKPVKLGLHNNSGGKLSWFGYDPALDPTGAASPFTNPASCAVGACTFANLGGVSQVAGPGFHRLDFSLFKDFPFNEKRKLQFRTEMFNIFNHPNFNAPGFGGNGVVAIGGSTNWTNNNFGRIGSTRDAPYDPRQIQFALKVLF